MYIINIAIGDIITKKIIDQYTYLPISANKKWRLRHPKEFKEQARQYCLKHRIKLNEYRNNWQKTERGKILRYNNHLRNNKKLRVEVITKLGGKCANPYNIDHSAFEQEQDYIHCLQVDHINGGGQKERKETSLHKIYHKILEHSEDYQLLCANCNWLKRWKKKEW